MAEEQCEWEQCANGTKREDNTHTHTQQNCRSQLEKGKENENYVGIFREEAKLLPGRGNNLGHCLASLCLALGCLVVLHASCHTPGVPFVVQLFHGLKN